MRETFFFLLWNRGLSAHKANENEYEKKEQKSKKEKPRVNTAIYGLEQVKKTTTHNSILIFFSLYFPYFG